MKDSKVIICAGGDGTPFIQGRSRHMLPAYGMPLVHRTQTQLLQQGFTDIHLACSLKNKAAYLLDGVSFLESPARTNDTREESVVWHYQKYVASDKPTMFLFGDAFYTDEIIISLSNDLGTDIRFYGKNKRYIEYDHDRTNEYYAIVLPYKDLDAYLTTISKVAKTRTYGYKLIPYLALRKFAGLESIYHTHSSDHWVECPDLTCDFDDQNDWVMKSRLFPHIFYMGEQ